MKVKYNDKYLERRYAKWATVELKVWLEELEDKANKNKLEPDEKLCIGPVRQEIARREALKQSKEEK